MAGSGAEPFKFFVYIVESPSAPDLYHGRSEGERVASTLRLDNIPCVTRTAINEEAFVAAIRIGLPEEMKRFSGRYPILHLSAHGSTSGIQLSNTAVVSWPSLRDLLIPVNESLGGALLLCMSACEGYSACQMAMQVGDARHPYLAMIGNCGSPTWSDTAVAYLAFYHLLAKGRPVPDAVSAMAAASGNDQWVVETADHSKEMFLEFLKQRELPADATTQLAAVARSENLPADAKALERGGGG